MYLIRDETIKGEAQLIYKSMKASLWYEMLNQIKQDSTNDKIINMGAQAQAAALEQLNKSVDRIATPISGSTTALLEQVWKEMLARVRYPKIPDEIIIGLDGVTHRVSQYQKGIGFRSGTTWSPEKESNTGHL